MGALGTVSLLIRYPVKSMLGEELATTELTSTGLAGDRSHALIHEVTGRVVSAKNPRLWRAMLTMTATSCEDVITIVFPDGSAIRSTDSTVDKVLSDFLGQQVTLTATPPENAQMEHSDPDEVIRHGVAAVVKTEARPLGAGTFFNFAPVHLLTTSTLARIEALAGTEALVATGAQQRYRPNVVIRTDAEGFTENDWLGRDLRIGGAVVRVIARTPRCAVPTLAHGPGIPRDPAALRVVADRNRVPAFDGGHAEPCAGVYAEVLRPGRVSHGDVVHLEA
ncbi:MAG TPA: MOSC N-terminal beta barrel domain-containing protein [Streptosporangiaceae bacterium]|nr:MOSC N-terminal beta barrel domain-containing protein [Streptosporangiaceae bacterium]